MGCPGCGHDAVPGASFCIACGEALPARCARCSVTLPADARFCPGCGVRVAPPADETVSRPPRAVAPPTPERASAPTVERATRPAAPAVDPMEELELEEAIERIRERDQRQRQRRRGLAVVGVVAVLMVLGAGAWLGLRAAYAPRPVQVAVRPPEPSAVAAPTAPEPSAEPGDVKRAAAAETAAPTPETPYVGAMAGLPEATTDVTPEPERELPARGPSPRADAAKRTARALPSLPEATPGRRERPQPESAPSAPPARSRAGAIDREVRVEIATEALADGLTSYTVRLRERDGRPVTDATVSIRGRRADGAVLEATLDRAAEPGAYRAVVRRPTELTDARLRVVGMNRVQEVPLPDAPR